MCCHLLYLAGDCGLNDDQHVERRSTHPRARLQLCGFLGPPPVPSLLSLRSPDVRLLYTVCSTVHTHICTEDERACVLSVLSPSSCLPTPLVPSRPFIYSRAARLPGPPTDLDSLRLHSPVPVDLTLSPLSRQALEVTSTGPSFLLVQLTAGRSFIRLLVSRFGEHTLVHSRYTQLAGAHPLSTTEGASVDRGS